MASEHQHHGRLLTGLLKEVSRSFYLTLRVLPRSIRGQIGLAYLLARATDTIADTELVPVQTRLEALDQLRTRIAGKQDAPLDFSALTRSGSSIPGAESERVLLLRVEEAITILHAFSPDDQKLIRQVLDTITSGQALDLRRFGARSATPRSLASTAELEDYTYRVAGCVGEFWTRMCLAHVFRNTELDESALLSNGVRFGQGLQLVNVLRDLPRDLRMGRCYLPGDELAAEGLRPEDLLSPGSHARLRPVFDRWLDKARDHLGAGWVYANTLPRSAVRIRLACAWPLLIGARTLALLRATPPLEAASPVKITRSELRGLLARSLILYPFKGAWERQFQQAARD